MTVFFREDRALFAKRNRIEKSLISQVIVVFTASKTGILTAFCQPQFAGLPLSENSKRHFDELS